MLPYPGCSFLCAWLEECVGAVVVVRWMVDPKGERRQREAGPLGQVVPARRTPTYTHIVWPLTQDSSTPRCLTYTVCCSLGEGGGEGGGARRQGVHTEDCDQAG